MSTIVTRAGKGSALTHNEVDANFVNLNTDKAEKTVANTFTANQIVSVTDNTNAALRITQLGTGNALLVEDSTNPDASPFVIDATGKVGIGTTTAVENFNLVSDGRNFLQLTRASTDSIQSVVSFRKSRGTNAAPTIVASADVVGDNQYFGYDGTAFIQLATIAALVDGTPGTNDMPGRLVFSTTADGASSTTERMRIDSAGNVGIGGTTAATVKIGISGTLPQSGGTGLGFVNYGTIASGTTGAYQSFRSALTTQATAFTLTNSFNYFVQGVTIGAGSAVTTQAGFNVDSTFTTATNNYGFRGQIASGTGRFNLYMDGTADNYFGGKIYLAANKELFIGGTTDATTPSLISDGTYLQLNAPAGSADMRFRVAGVERMRINSAGNVGIGATAGSDTSILSGKNITGATVAFGFRQLGSIQSDVTSQANGIQSAVSTAAASFTLTNLRNFFASQGTIGATSAVTNQFGFFVDSGLTGATNNYGFYGNIASGTNRYNLYMQGSAANYFNGDLTVYGGTAIPAGGTAGSGYKFSSTANFGVFFGSGAPTLSAAKGSLYLRSDGTTTNNRMYVNTDGSTTWTAVTTAA